METAMLNEVRDTLGKFAPKSEVPRKVRSVNLTDDAWQWLAAVAKKAGMSRNDYLEALAEGENPLMETVKPQLKPFMETVETGIDVDGVNIEKQPDTKLYPFIETVLTEVESVKLELEAVRAEKQLLQLETTNLQAEREELAQLKKQVKEHALEVHREGRSIELEKDRWQGQLSEARADLAAAQATIVQQKGKILELERGYTLKPNPAERRLRLEIGELRSELADLKQKSAAAGKDLPEAADLLNQLKAHRKKSSATLTDVEKILEILEGS